MLTCSECGRANPDDARYCSGCGRPVAEARSANESRKTVSVVFCDVTGSTELGERLDPEALRAVMARYFAAMRAAIERHGGTVEKFIGDAVMAVFGVPVLHEDDAARAVRAACEMRDAMQPLNDDLRRDHGVALSVRIGVNTGEVLASGIDAETLVTGDAVNVAARLEAAAPPGEILIGEPTHALVRDVADTEPVELLTLKGKAEPVAAYRLIRVADPTAARSRVARSAMIGRDRELANLRHAFDRVAADSSCVLFTVLASAGQGKSRLVEEFVDQLSDRATVLSGHCPPYGEGITYLPAVEVVRQVLAGADEFRSLSELLAGAPRSDAVVARIGELLGLSSGVASAEETHWAFRVFLETLAAHQPVVVVFDDIQWAEPTFLDMIEHIADWSVGTPILVLCMARPELLESRDGWAGGKANAQSVLLRPLDHAEMAQMIANLAGSVPIADELQTALTATADGNPLFVEQLLSMLIDDGVLTAVTTGSPFVVIPPTISALLASRLDRLPPDERAVLEAASVIGQEFRSAAAAALMPDEQAAHIDETFARLLRKRLVRAAPAAGAGALRFDHLLIRDAAYTGMAKSRRADLHESLATWMDSSADEPDEILGYHLEQALRLRRELRPTTDDDVAMGARAAWLLASAGRRALGRDDVGAAVNLLSRAETLLPTDDRERVTILADLAWGLDSTGDQERKERVFDEALALAVQHDDDRLRAHVLARRIETLDSPDLDAAIDDDLPWMIDVFERFGDDVGLARAWRVSGLAEWNRGMAGRFEVGLLRGLDYAIKADDAHEIARTALDLSFVLSRGPTPIDEVVRRSNELIASSATRAVEAYTGHSLGHLLCRQGNFDGARAAARSLREFLWETGQASMYWFMAECEADVEAVAGHYADAMLILSDGIDHLEMIEGTRSHVLAGLRAHWAYETGDWETADRDASFAAEGEDFLAYTAGLGVLARLRARAGDFDEGVELGQQAASRMAGSDMLLDHATVMFDLGDALRMAGRADDAREALSESLRMSTLKGDVIGAERTRTLIASLDD